MSEITRQVLAQGSNEVVGLKVGIYGGGAGQRVPTERTHGSGDGQATRATDRGRR